MRKRKREKRRKKTEKSTDEGSSRRECFLQIIPLFSLLSSNFLMLDKGGAKFFRVLNKTVGMMSRRQNIFVQNQNVALAHLCCLCASSRRVRDTRRRNARAGEEGCENKE